MSVGEKMVYPSSHDTGDGVRWHAGITLREYYAGQAMAALLSNNSVIAPNASRGWDYVNTNERGVAEQALLAADALLAELWKVPY